MHVTHGGRINEEMEKLGSQDIVKNKVTNYDENRGEKSM